MNKVLRANKVGKATRSPRGKYSIPPLAGIPFWAALAEHRERRRCAAGGADGAAVVVAVARGNAPPVQRYGSLKVVTTKMKPGYLRKNGVPYTENATVTEYFDRHKESNGDEWLTVTTLVEDPKYLNQPFTRARTSRRNRTDRSGDRRRASPNSAGGPA